MSTSTFAVLTIDFFATHCQYLQFDLLVEMEAIRILSKRCEKVVKNKIYHDISTIISSRNVVPVEECLQTQ